MLVQSHRGIVFVYPTHMRPYAISTGPRLDQQQHPAYKALQGILNRDNPVPGPTVQLEEGFPTTTSQALRTEHLFGLKRISRVIVIDMYISPSLMK